MADDGGLISNNITSMLYLIFKRINPATSISVSNPKNENEKVTLAKLGRNVKYFLDNMSSNYTIFIDKGDFHEDYDCHLFRDLLSPTNSNFNCFIEITKDDWYTGSEILASDIIRNTTDNYNNMIALK